MAEISSTNIVLKTEHSDYGTCYEVTCPECEDRVIVAEYESNGPKCQCGYQWSFSIKAIGWKFDV